MNSKNTFLPGKVIMTSCGTYTHYSIISDIWCRKGKPMLISANAKAKTVTEEPYDDVVRDRLTCLAPFQSHSPASITLNKARSQIGTWEYRLLSRNCEHFVCWAAGLDVSPRQVKSSVCGAILAGGVAATIAKKPSLGLVLGMALVGGFVGLTIVQEPRKVVVE